jgi:antitoxin (DNA-binding transcriptional repressor) of toxin-antitoxin stability system
VKTITIRDLRQRWPEAEAALQTEKKILITRDAKPVAMLVSVPEKPSSRKRWDPDKHCRRIKAILGEKSYASIDERLAEARADRSL